MAHGPEHNHSYGVDVEQDNRRAIGDTTERSKAVILVVRQVTGVEHVHVWTLSNTEDALTAHVII